MDLAAENPVHATLGEVERRLGSRAEIELSILMPCLNEAETLAACIEKATGFLHRSGVAGEVIVADNGSTDASRDIARALGARVVEVAARGYGAALGAGIAAARGRYVIMGDSDDSYDFAALDGFVVKLRQGADLVMGNRFKGGIADQAMPRLHRYLGNPVLSFMGRLFFRSPIGDFHCGLRGFARAAILDLRLAAPGMEFASEMVVKATLAGLKVAEVPTTLKPDGRSRPPHLNSWRDGWRHLKLLLTFAPHWLFLYPGVALAGIGGGLTLALIPGPLVLGAVRLDAATLLFAIAAVLVGAQLISFYGLAKLHAVSEGLLPESRRYRRAVRLLTVDRFCQVGGALALTGLAIAVTAVVRWGLAGFGSMDPPMIVRFAAGAALALALGAQAITTGFLWGLMTSRRSSALPAAQAEAIPQAPAAPASRAAA
jgi:glycosyltransferase involved in cell wall biosynthesis